MMWPHLRVQREVKHFLNPLSEVPEFYSLRSYDCLGVQDYHWKPLIEREQEGRKGKW